MHGVYHSYPPGFTEKEEDHPLFDLIVVIVVVVLAVGGVVWAVMS